MEKLSLQRRNSNITFILSIFFTETCEWEEWTDWGTCSETSNGQQNRTRTKTKGGDDCTENVETQACNTSRRKRSTDTSSNNNSTSTNSTATNSTSGTNEEVKKDCKWEKKCICEDIPDTTVAPDNEVTQPASSGNSSSSTNNSSSSNDNNASNGNNDNTAISYGTF